MGETLEMDRVSLALDVVNRERVFTLACFELERLDIPAGEQQYQPCIIHQFIRGLGRGDGGRRCGSNSLR